MPGGSGVPKQRRCVQRIGLIRAQNPCSKRIFCIGQFGLTLTLGGGASLAPYPWVYGGMAGDLLLKYRRGLVAIQEGSFLHQHQPRVNGALCA